MQWYVVNHHTSIAGKDIDMMTVVIKVDDIKFSNGMRDRFGSQMGASIQKTSKCPKCGGEITWYICSGEECKYCKKHIPPISDIVESQAVRLVYYRGIEKININLWRS
jgi:hypothetical protein